MPDFFLISIVENETVGLDEISTRFSFLPNSFSVFALNLSLELIHEFRGSPSPMKSKYLLIKERMLRAKIIEMQYYSKDYRGKLANIAREMKITPQYAFQIIERFDELGTLENRAKKYSPRNSKEIFLSPQ